MTNHDEVEATTEDFLLVRLKASSKRSGIKTRVYSRRYAPTASWIRFRAQPGKPSQWVKVPTRIARDLERVRQDPYDPGSPLLFDVKTAAEATAAEAKAAEERRARRAREDSTVAMADDLTAILDDGSGTSVGRGDLSPEDVTAARAEALEAASTAATRTRRKTGRRRY